MAIKDIVQEVLHSSIDHQTKVLVTKAQLVGTQSVQVRVIARSSNSGDNSEIFGFIIKPKILFLISKIYALPRNLVLVLVKMYLKFLYFFSNSKATGLFYSNLWFVIYL